MLTDVSSDICVHGKHDVVDSIIFNEGIAVLNRYAIEVDNFYFQGQDQPQNLNHRNKDAQH